MSAETGLVVFQSACLSGCYACRGNATWDLRVIKGASIFFTIVTATPAGIPGSTC